MKKMKIYEPAMCCETGLCGVGVNEELLRISTVINTLKSMGIEVQRFNLNSSPNEFVINQKVNDTIMQQGIECLPIVTVDDEMIITGRYPTNDEILELLNIKTLELGMKKPGSIKLDSCCAEASKDSCCSDDDCCSSKKTVVRKEENK